MTRTYPREIRLPAPHEEVSPDDDEIVRCPRHDVLYRQGQACLVCERDGEGA